MNLFADLVIVTLLLVCASAAVAMSAFTIRGLAIRLERLRERRWRREHPGCEPETPGLRQLDRARR